MIARRMSTLETLPTKDLTAFHDQIQSRYDGFKKRGLKLDLTRGKPSSEQLDLSNGLLGLPGPDDFLAFDKTDTRNYGVLQGLPELRALLAPLFGVAPAQVVLGDNSSLALMHDAVAFALLKGTVGSPRPWSKESRVAFLCPVPGYDRHFGICQDFGIEMIPVPLTSDGPDMATVEKLVAFYVQEHNSRLPHSALSGQTPDEMYFSKGGSIPAELAAARQNARQARVEANRKRTCGACELATVSIN